ncbi:MAG: LytTR family DNA-binding domain-containing protein [Lentimicrobium sp.]|nr:LytTR family DNA-binding domain-containing protein [Lentimicrobium sp.]
MNLGIFVRKAKSKMLRTIIIDDEEHMQQSLEKLLQRYCPYVQVVARAGSVASGLACIREHRPDVVLLDIKMDDGTGFDLLKQAEPIDFKVIFITAYDQYAVEAFRYSALDYLLKPVIPGNLAEAIQKAEETRIKDLELQLSALKNNMAADNQLNKKLVLKTQESIYIVVPDEILYCQADSNYSTFTLNDGRRITVSRTLREFEELLKQAGFFRVHKSFLINLSRIIRLDKSEGGALVMSNGDKIPVGASRKEELMELFNQL